MGVDITAFDAIILDLGGVILNIDYGQTIYHFSRLSGIDGSALYTQHHQDPLFDDIETGRISADEFREGLRTLLKVSASDQELDDAWNAMLLDIPPRRIAILKALAQSKRIFLLSNTNEIHKRAFDQIVDRSFGDALPDFSALFERAYYSHLVGDRKPNPDLFRRIVAENSLDPTRTLFIDDTLRHVEGARQAGLAALHLAVEQTLESLLPIATTDDPLDVDG